MINSVDASDIIQIQLHECGKEKCIPNKDILFDEKTWHTFHYIVSGRGTFILNGKAYKLKKGSLFYIPPATKPHYYPDKDDPWTYVWVGFSGFSSLDFLKQIGLSEEEPIYKDNDCQLKDLFNQLASSYLEYRSFDVSCLGYLYLILSQMIRKQTHFDPNLSAKESHILQAKEFIKNNYQFDISIKDIALSLNLSPNYLSNIFQEILGCTTKRYLTKVRMERSVLLLQNPEVKIKDVGTMCGYPNPLHFSAEFKKYQGLSPKDYRNKFLRSEK